MNIFDLIEILDRLETRPVETAEYITLDRTVREANETIIRLAEAVETAIARLRAKGEVELVELLERGLKGQ